MRFWLAIFLCLGIVQVAQNGIDDPNGFMLLFVISPVTLVIWGLLNLYKKMFNSDKK
jgi:hypothetical protein